MIKHIVMWKLKEISCGKGKEENKAIIKQKLEALKGRIDGLIEIEVGIDFSCTDSSYDLCLNSVFESRDALNYYQNHPLHKEIIPFITEARTERIVVDYEI